jgi:hypothetical protein
MRRRIPGARMTFSTLPGPRRSARSAIRRRSCSTDTTACMAPTARSPSGPRRPVPRSGGATSSTWGPPSRRRRLRGRWTVATRSLPSSSAAARIDRCSSRLRATRPPGWWHRSRRSSAAPRAHAGSRGTSPRPCHSTSARGAFTSGSACSRSRPTAPASSSSSPPRRWSNPTTLRRRARMRMPSADGWETARRICSSAEHSARRCRMAAMGRRSSAISRPWSS